MPRVSEEHLAARRAQILDAARRLFAANGFHATSMADVLRESELSAGAVYRYFAGKEDIIAAIAEEALARIRAAFEDDDGDVPVGDLIERVFTVLDAQAEQDDVGRLALQVWAEAARTPALRERIFEAMTEARAALAARLARADEPGVDPEATAKVVLALLPGYLHANVMIGDLTPAGYRTGLEGLATLLHATERP